MAPDVNNDLPEYQPPPPDTPVPTPPDSMAPPDAPIGGGSPLDTQYNPDGSVMNEAQKAEAVKPEDAGPTGMPAAAASDAPFSEDVIPGGWSRFPTAEEVAYLNKLYPV